MGESEDYMSPEYQPDPFKKVYWNMIQTLLWIRYGEASSDDIRETDDSLLLDAGPEEVPRKNSENLTPVVLVLTYYLMFLPISVGSIST